MGVCDKFSVFHAVDACKPWARTTMVRIDGRSIDFRLQLNYSGKLRKEIRKERRTTRLGKVLWIQLSGVFLPVKMTRA